jgi:RNA polymerase primary sigma factor
VSESFDALMRKAAAMPLLRAEEEKALAKRVEAGDHEAKQILVERNIRLAVYVARRYQNAGVPLEDLVQEAVIGLHRAAEKFDWRRDLKFSTYATWWIRHMIQRAVHKDRATIRVPGHIVERQRKLHRYLQEHPEENLADAAEALELTLQQAEDAVGGAKVVASLDAPIGTDDPGGSRYDMIRDDAAADPAESLPDQFPGLAEALRNLTAFERRVVELRFGFAGPVMSRDETADLLGVRPHVVQRAQRDALQRLRTALPEEYLAGAE